MIRSSRRRAGAAAEEEVGYFAARDALETVAVAVIRVRGGCWHCRYTDI